MARWKERPEESYRFAVQSFFEPTDHGRLFKALLSAHLPAWKIHDLTR